MKSVICLLPMALMLVAAHAAPPSSPDLGKANGTCRAHETGPAITVHVLGLKDRSGVLRLELYPPTQEDFLADDNVLLSAGKTFARVDEAIPATSPVILCIRAPAPGRYTMALLHDRDGNLKFNAFNDGAGFPGDPKIGFSKPKASQAMVDAGPGITSIAIRMNYWHGLSFGPLKNVN